MEMPFEVGRIYEVVHRCSLPSSFIMITKLTDKMVFYRWLFCEFIEINDNIHKFRIINREPEIKRFKLPYVGLLTNVYASIGMIKLQKDDWKLGDSYNFIKH